MEQTMAVQCSGGCLKHRCGLVKYVFPCSVLMSTLIHGVPCTATVIARYG